MLVLTRKFGEKINIGDDIVIKVVEISKGSVKLGIDAPKDVFICREELYEKIQEENRMASQVDGKGVDAAANLFRNRDGN